MSTSRESQELKKFSSFLDSESQKLLANLLVPTSGSGYNCQIVHKLVVIDLLNGFITESNNINEVLDHLQVYIKSQRLNCSSHTWESVCKIQNNFLHSELLPAWERISQPDKSEKDAKLSMFRVCQLLGGESGDGSDEFSVILRGTDIEIKKCETEQEASILVEMLNKIIQ